MGNSISLQSFKEFDAYAISSEVSCAGMFIYSPLQHLMVNRTKSQKLPGLMAAHQKSKYFIELRQFSSGGAGWLSGSVLDSRSGNKLGGDYGENDYPRDQNCTLIGTQGEVGVYLKKKKKIFFFKGDPFSFCHHTNASCGDNLLPLHCISPSI